MIEKEVKIKKLKDNAKIPTYGTDYAAGADLYACIDEDMTFAPGETKLVPTGISLEVPVGYAGLIYARSGLASKRDLAPANKVGVIDSDYRGEVMVALHNHGCKEQVITKDERIAQLVITPYLKAIFSEVDELEDKTKTRGANGFGSTGTK
jgi:dUTP pyrophosphatase